MGQPQTILCFEIFAQKSRMTIIVHCVVVHCFVAHCFARVVVVVAALDLDCTVVVHSPVEVVVTPTHSGMDPLAQRF